MVTALSEWAVGKAVNVLESNLTLLIFAVITSMLQLGLCYAVFLGMTLPGFQEPTKAAWLLIHVLCNFGLWWLAEFFVARNNDHAEKAKAQAEAQNQAKLDALQAKLDALQAKLDALQAKLAVAAVQAKAVADLGRRLQSEGAARADIWRNEIVGHALRCLDAAQIIATVDRRIGEQAHAAEETQKALVAAERALVEALAGATTAALAPSSTRDAE